METHTPQLAYVEYARLVIHKRKWMMITVGLAAFAAVQFFGYLVTPVWEGTTLLLVERTSKQNLSVFREINTPVSGAEDADPALQLIPLLTGWDMGYDVVRKFGLDNMTREKRYHPPTMRDMIKGAIIDLIYSPYYIIKGWEEPNWTDKAAEEFVEDSIDIEEEEERTSVINLTVYGESPQLAADIANGMAALLEERTRDFSQRKAKIVYEHVARQVAEAEAQLKKVQADVVHFQEANNLYGPDDNRRLLLEKRQQLQTELDATRRLQGEVAAGVAAGQTEKQFLQANIALSPTIRQIESNLVTLNARRWALLLEKTAEHPDVQIVETEIERNQRQLQDALGAERSTLKVREGELEQNIRDVESQIQAMPGREMELARLQQLLAVNRSVFETSKSRLEQVAMDQLGMGNDYTVRVLDRAIVPPGRDQDWPLWWLNILAGLFLGFLLGVGGAFSLEYWNRPVLAGRDVEQVLGLRLLGRFPELKDRDL